MHARSAHSTHNSVYDSYCNHNRHKHSWITRIQRPNRNPPAVEGSFRARQRSMAAKLWQPVARVKSHQAPKSRRSRPLAQRASHPAKNQKVHSEGTGNRTTKAQTAAHLSVRDDFDVRNRCPARSPHTRRCVNSNTTATASETRQQTASEEAGAGLQCGPATRGALYTTAKHEHYASSNVFSCHSALGCAVAAPREQRAVENQ